MTTKPGGGGELPETRTEAGAWAPAPGPLSELRRGESLGRYLILERLGAGGMGVVYAAFDPELDRKVAIKLLHGERATRGGARLLREAQALARLQHPNVIAVHDVGTFEGRVFVAMELVDGETLAERLRDGAADWREVVALYVQAGRGLAAAHAAGLVHRDFKPDNTLVGRDGRVRVLDFGLARAAADGGDDAEPADGTARGSDGSGLLATPLTRAGVVVGTPAFMAPEQLEGRPADARSDQYSFAVALYGALYGGAPYAGERLEERVAAARAGRLEEGPAGSRVPRRIRALLARALAADPAARHPGMAELLAALADDPELRARRRRIRWAGAAAAALALGAIGLSLTREARLCRGAERSLAGLWDAPAKARIAAAFARSGVPYAATAWNAVERALDRWSAAWVAGRTEACEATHRRGVQSPALLDLRTSCLDGRLETFAAFTALLAEADAPLVERSTQAAFALPRVEACADRDALLARVPPPEGEANRSRVEATRRALAGVRALRLAGRFAPGREAALALEPAIERESYRPLRAEYQLERGDLEARLGEFAASEATYERALREALAGRDPVLAAEAAGMAALVVGVRQARHAEGRRWAELGFALLEGAGGDDRVEAIVRGHLGNILQATGDMAGARGELEAVLALQERSIGPDAPEVGRTLNNLGNAYYGAGELDRALATYHRSLAIKEATVGADHPDVGSSLNNLALVTSDLERYDEALGYLHRALELDERTLGPDHPSVGLALGNLAAIQVDTGHPEEALAAATRSLAIAEKALAPGHVDLGYSLNNVGLALLELGRIAEARAAFARALAVREAGLGADHPLLAFTLTGLGRCAIEEGRPAAAIVSLRRAVAIRSAAGVDAPQLAESRFHLGRALRASGGSRAEALRQAVAAREALVAAGGRPRRLLEEVEGWLARESRD